MHLQTHAQHTGWKKGNYLSSIQKKNPKKKLTTWSAPLSKTEWHNLVCIWSQPTNTCPPKKKHKEKKFTNSRLRTISTQKQLPPKQNQTHRKTSNGKFKCTPEYSRKCALEYSRIRTLASWNFPLSVFVCVWFFVFVCVWFFVFVCVWFFVFVCAPSNTPEYVHLHPSVRRIFHTTFCLCLRLIFCIHNNAHPKVQPK